MAAIDSGTVRELTTLLPDRVLTATDDTFAETLASAVWNGAIRRQPVAITQPATVAEVAAVVKACRRHSADLTVRGGGHGFAGHAVADGGVMLDLRNLDQIVVDPEARRVRCGAGASWAALDAATAEHGLAVPGGFISHTGVSGLTLGGGMGWLSRWGGLSCDNLLSVELVTADGQVVAASAEEHPDLFWAVRGGGGNFGVVTRLEFAAHELNPMANLGLFFWRPEDAQGPLRHARDLIPRLPDELTGFIAGLSAPPAPFVPPEYHGTPGFAVALVNWGSPEEHAELVAPLREMSPLFELVTPIPHVALQQMFDESAPWGILGYEKAIYFETLTDSVIDILAERLPQKESPLSFVPIFSLGGAYARVPEEETAFGGSRSVRWTVNVVALDTDDDMLVRDRAWARDFWAALRPHADSSGAYINFLADDDEDRVRAAYGEKYDRLSAIKREWDPENFFHHNANIRPVAHADA
ncbi:MAG: FAD-binding oxidoreductase [Marmoricola sp.]